MATYAVIDLEWNQYHGKAKPPVSEQGVIMREEVIQIGAVKVDAHFQVTDTFNAMIRLPQGRVLSRFVADLVHRSQADAHRGEHFPDAFARFTAWLADVEAIFTWGPDDHRIMDNNLAFYQIPWPVQPWYDAQRVYRRQAGDDTGKCSLPYAMERLGLTDDRRLHDALNDAAVTALVCSRLDMQRGLAEYDVPEAPSEHADPSLGSYATQRCTTRKEARDAALLLELHCPVCADILVPLDHPVGDHEHWMLRCKCDAHGEILARYRVRRVGGNAYVGRCTLIALTEAQEAHFYKALKKQQMRRLQRRQRRTSAEMPAHAESFPEE